MNDSVVGAAAGATLALTWVILGFWACFFVGLAMVVGAFVAKTLSGRIDVRALGDALRGRRSS
ncbi:hypothetical protein ACXR2W_08035 [Leucobacter sp. HY1908]